MSTHFGKIALQQKLYPLDAHIRSTDAVLAEMVKKRAKQSGRTIPKEIERAIRIAYKLGVIDDRPA